MRPLKQKVSISLDSDIIEIIRIIAEEDNRTFSQYINMALKEYLKYRAEVLGIKHLFK